MTTIGTSEFRHQSSDAEPRRTNSLECLRLDADLGGLVIIGPTGRPLRGIDALLSAPGVEPIEALSSRLATWKSASAETIEVGRAVSKAVRNGHTAVVYLDSHVGEGEPVPADLHEFVCMRLSQIMVGVSDVPAYVALHGELMVRSLVVESLGDEHPKELGTIVDGYPVWQLTAGTMFPGVVVSMCPANRDAAAMVAMHGWFECHRSKAQF